jgi:transmembrane sensor
MQSAINFRDEHIIIGRILAKYPLATDEEHQVLEDWKQKNGNRQIFDSIMESRQTDLQRIVAIIADMERVRQKYLAVIPEAGKTKTFWWNNWKIFAAAASIAALLVSTMLWLDNRKNKEVAGSAEKPLTVSHDVAPGTFRAKLVLADGSVVVLDSIGNKALSPQGGANVFSQNGQLIYRSTNNKSVIIYNTLSTAKGEMYSLLLADGSRLWLNSQSSVHYPVNVPANKAMEVTTTGEVFFEIVHNPQRPFRVRVNGLLIDDIGTRFNVNAYTDEDNIILTLIEGSVQAGKGDRTVLVTSGQEAIAGKSQNDNTIKVVADADLEKAIAWKNGQFKFNKDDLRTVMRQLARWYDLDVVYQGNIPRGQFVGTVPRDLNLSQVLEILASSDIHFNIEGKKLIVTP